MRWPTDAKYQENIRISTVERLHSGSKAGSGAQARERRKRERERERELTDRWGSLVIWAKYDHRKLRRLLTVRSLAHGWDSKAAVAGPIGPIHRSPAI